MEREINSFPSSCSEKSSVATVFSVKLQVAAVGSNRYVFQACIKDHQDFSHTGGEGHLSRFSGQAETLVKLHDHRVVVCRHQGGHIQGLADRRPTALDLACAAILAAIPVHGS